MKLHRSLSSFTLPTSLVHDRSFQSWQHLCCGYKTFATPLRNFSNLEGYYHCVAWLAQKKTIAPTKFFWRADVRDKVCKIKFFGGPPPVVDHWKHRFGLESARIMQIGYLNASDYFFKTFPTRQTLRNYKKLSNTGPWLRLSIVWELTNSCDSRVQSILT